MRIGRDDDPRAGLAGQAAWLSRRSSRSGCELISSTVPVSIARSTIRSRSVRAGPTTDPSPGEMADGVDVRVLHRGQNALRRIPLLRVVHGRDHPVEPGEHVVVDVQARVGTDVDLDPVQQPERASCPLSSASSAACRSSRPSRRCE